MKRLIYILITAFLPGFISAVTPVAIEDFISGIIANNIGIKTDEALANAEKNALESTNNLSDPELDFTHQWGQKGIGNKWSIGISQSFEWPGVYSAKKDLIRSRQKVLDRSQNAKTHSLRLEIYKLVLENIYLKKKESLRRSQLMRIDSLICVYQKGVNEGEISILDLNKLKIERVNTQRLLTESLNSLNENFETLTGLNGGKNCRNILDGIDNFPQGVLLSMESYITAAMHNDPNIQYNTSMSNLLKDEGKTLGRSFIPSFSLGYSHDYELGEHFNGISLGLTIPVFSNRHRKQEIEHKKIANLLEISDRETEIRTSVRKLYSLVSSLDNELENYGDALFDVNNFRLLDIALAAGHISLIEYLTQTGYFRDAAEGYIDMDYQRAVAFAELNQWNY